MSQRSHVSRFNEANKSNRVLRYRSASAGLNTAVIKNLRNIDTANLTRQSSMTRVASKISAAESQSSSHPNTSNFFSSQNPSSTASNTIEDAQSFENYVDLEEASSGEEEIVKEKRKSKPITEDLFVQKINENGELVYFCLKCDDKASPIKSNTGDGNLRKHLWHVHHDPDYLYPSQYKRLVKNSVQSITPARKKELDEAIVNCIIQDSRTFNDFSKPGMREFLNKVVPNYTPPHRTTISKKLKTKYSEYKKMLIETLKNVEKVSITTDMLKNRNNYYYICLTGHFPDKFYNSISTILSFKRFYGKHDSVRI